MTTIVINVSKYDALVAAALEGDLESVRRLDIDIRNEAGAEQFRVWVRWIDIGGAPKPSHSPVEWPFTQKGEIVLDRAIEKDDVLSYLDNRSTEVTSVHVTRDPEGVIGWYELESFPFVA